MKNDSYNENEIWADLHKGYKEQGWIDKPSIFATTALRRFPAQGRLLELGAGLGQDSRFFAEHGYEVVASDIETTALESAKSQVPAKLAQHISFQKIDLREELPFKDSSFNIVYAHLSLHYFDSETTTRLVNEIARVLKPGGVFGCLVNSVHDPEYRSGEQVEEDFFQIGKATKRYFSVASVRYLMHDFEINLLDELGETYKDNAKGVHNLVRFIGKKPLKPPSHSTAIPYVGGIIERTHNGRTELLLQTRWKPHVDPLYSGTLEFPAGVLDKPYENVYDTITREIKEEAGLTLKAIKNDSQTTVYSPKGSDGSFAFRPFCCTQQLKGGEPWIGFIFICQVEDTAPRAQLSETKDVTWYSADEVRELVTRSPEKFFGLELPAFEYYFAEKDKDHHGRA